MIEQKIRKNKEVLALIRKGNDNLGAMGYTDHSKAHAAMVADRAAYIPVSYTHLTLPTT